MRRIVYLVQKEFRQILREPVFLGLIFGMPFIQIVLLGFAITMDVKNVALAVVDHDHSVMSRRLIDAFVQTESFEYKGQVTNDARAVKLLDENKIRLALIIPAHFERNLIAGRQPKIQTLVDGVDGNTAGVAIAYANQIAFKLQKEWMQKSSRWQQIKSKIHLTSLEPRMLYNPTLESVNNIVPGILAVLLMMITSFLTGMSIVREKEIGTLEQLMVTPLRRGELIIGKVIPLVVVGFLLFNVGVLGGGLIFGLWIKGNLLTLYIMVFLFMMTTLGLGILVSTVAKTQQQAMFMTWFLMIFALLLSGFFIPIENMPPAIQLVTYLNPVRYFMVVVRELYLKGTEFRYLWSQALIMTVFGLGVLTVSVLLFHKRVR
ncbi:MAG TPA: ABC transporter permease [Caldithrix abyssi]|uniref:ABC transporter permease n=1 Tax=Caldithrix abyssi TaxID=187145 RepID=A0A7V5UEV7_CALAY|nr:ABC transporter permease [Caldithrix abyssi]